MEELCIYFRSLQSGAQSNKQIFDTKLAELNAHVNENGLGDEDFKIIFRSWLNAKLPVSKWTSLGRCMVPATRLDDDDLQKALCWLLTNYQTQSVTRIAFLLNWLAGLMDHNLLNIVILDHYYDFFYFFIQMDRIGSFAVKFVYNLTKPEDVTRWRVLELLNIMKLRGTGKGISEIQVLLGLFKSYKPECVPESVPAQLIHSVFPKLNATLLARLRRVQDRANAVQILHQRKLQWSVLMTFSTRRGTVESAVPDLEFVNVGSQLYSHSKLNKNCLQFRDSVELVAYAIRAELMWPANSVSLLANSAGELLLALAAPPRRAQLAHALHHTLYNCFLSHGAGASPPRGVCVDLLCRVAQLQATLTQPLSVIAIFCSSYLPFWNATHYFEQMMALLEWVHFDTFDELHDNILVYVEQVFVSAGLLERCSILHTLTRMYAHIAFSAVKKKQDADAAGAAEGTQAAALALPRLSAYIQELNRKTLQVYPESSCAALMATSVYLELSRAEWSWSWSRSRSQSPSRSWSVFPNTLGALALASPSAFCLDWLLRLVLQYRNVYQKLRRSKHEKAMHEQIQSIEALKEDFINCLWFDEAFESSDKGTLIGWMSSANRRTVLTAVRRADRSFNIGSHLAFAPYTYMTSDNPEDSVSVSKDGWLDTAIAPNFPDIANFINLVDVSR